MRAKREWILILLSLLLIFGFSACGEKEAEPESEPPVVEEPAAEPEFKYISIASELMNIEEHPLYMDFTTEFDNDLVNVKLYIKGENIRMDTQDPEMGSVSLITNPGGYYIIMHDYKAYMGTGEPVNVEEMAFMIHEEDIPNYEVKTGREEIGGVMYDYERLKSIVESEDGTDVESDITFYFLEGTDEWAAMKTEETMMYIKEISQEVDDSVFTIPSDYSNMTSAG